MQTENKLNITAGEWKKDETYLTKGNHFDWFTCFILSEKGGKIADVYGDEEKESEANATLIADAGTTANKCGLLPSELLKQRDELREALDGLLRNYCTVFNVTESARVAMAILQSTKQQ